MKIIETTDTRLRLQHRPVSNWMTGGCFLVFGLPFLIHGLLWESAFASLTCTRSLTNLINCELRQSTLLGRAQKLKLFDPHSTYIKTNRSGRSTTHQLIIVTPLREYHLLSRLSYQENVKSASKIDDFITSSQSYLSLQQQQHNHLFFHNLFMLGLVVTGAFYITSPVSNCTFYKSINKVVIERLGIRGKKVIEHPLEDIQRFDIQDKQLKSSKLYRAVIVLKSDKKIPINPEYTDEQCIRSVVSMIRLFLQSSK